MRNLLIFGTGRSGTSMVAALFRHSGVFFGDQLIPAKRANPFGYYEDPEVNNLNTLVIQRMIRALWTTRLSPGWVHPIHRSVGGSWLAAPWYLPSVEIPSAVREPMLRKLQNRPFCLKDPRFSVTLPAWRPWLPAGIRFLVVFRDPHRTTDSILRDAAESYDPPLPVTPHWAYLHWWRNYGRLLEQFLREGEWLFVDYDDVVRGTAIAAIEAFAEARADTSQIDPRISRAQASPRLSRRRITRCCERLYARLRARAAEDLARWGGASDKVASHAGNNCALPTALPSPAPMAR